MSTTNKEGQEGLVPCEPQTLAEYADQVERLTDENLDTFIGFMESHLHTGKWGSDRLEILITERSRRWRIRKGEGRNS